AGRLARRARVRAARAPGRPPLRPLRLHARAALRAARPHGGGVRCPGARVRRPRPAPALRAARRPAAGLDPHRPEVRGAARARRRCGVARRLHAATARPEPTTSHPMVLRFLGTRGEIEARTRAHRMHASLEVAYRGRSVMIDCGADWRARVWRLAPKAIVLTHAHPDHAAGL